MRDMYEPRLWHRPDWSSFVAGGVFVAVGMVGLVLGRDRFADALAWIWSATLLGLGVALLLRGQTQHRDRYAATEEEPTSAEPVEPTSADPES